MAKGKQSEQEPEPAPPKPLEVGIEDDEIKEFEDYFRKEEKTASPYHTTVAIEAGAALILIDILRELRAARYERQAAKPAPEKK